MTSFRYNGVYHRPKGSFFLTNFFRYAIIKLRIGDGTHNKKRYSQKQINTKGATPIEKNVIVVDEQGNEYEATYPKRAKGLVKNGRARFVDENKICLACPPDKTLEENNMSNNISKNQIFNQIAELQKSLESIDKFLFKIQCVTDSQSFVEQEDGEPITLDYLPDVAMEKIKAIREIVLEREKTINKMLDFYLKLYQDLEKDEKE
jgi:hypothetical protein